MHARPTSVPLAISVGLHRFFLLALVFAFAIAMGSLALQSPGPRTVQFNFPQTVKTGPTSTVVPAPR